MTITEQDKELLSNFKETTRIDSDNFRLNYDSITYYLYWGERLFITYNKTSENYFITLEIVNRSIKDLVSIVEMVTGVVITVTSKGLMHNDSVLPIGGTIATKLLDEIFKADQSKYYQDKKFLEFFTREKPELFQSELLNWETESKWLAVERPQLFDKQRYDWENYSGIVAQHCPENLDADLYNWEEASEDVLLHCPEKVDTGKVNRKAYVAWKKEQMSKM